MDPCARKPAIKSLQTQINAINQDATVVAAAAAVVEMTENIATMSGRVTALQETHTDLAARVQALEEAV